jgi:hypothetical protein
MASASLYARAFAAFTIANIAALIGSSSAGHASQIARKSASAGIGSETATDAFAAPAAESTALPAESTGFWSGSSPFTRSSDPSQPDGFFVAYSRR